MSKVNVNAVSVDTESEDLKNVESVEDVAALGIFDHFNERAKNDSNQSLFDIIQDERSPEPEEEEEASDTKIMLDPKDFPAGEE